MKKTTLGALVSMILESPNLLPQVIPAYLESSVLNSPKTFVGKVDRTVERTMDKEDVGEGRKDTEKRNKTEEIEYQPLFASFGRGIWWRQIRVKKFFSSPSTLRVVDWRWHLVLSRNFPRSTR